MKIIGKSLRTRSRSESSQRQHSKNDLFEFQSATMTPEVPLWRLGRLLGAPLGPSGPSTWPSWRPLGGSLAASWPLLGGLGSLLATLVAPKTLNFACWVHFLMTSARLGLCLPSKAAKSCREPAKSWRTLACSDVPPTSNSHKGAAVARSELNNIRLLSKK